MLASEFSSVTQPASQIRACEDVQSLKDLRAAQEWHSDGSTASSEELV